MEIAMKTMTWSPQDILAHQEREVRRQFSALRRVRQRPLGVIDSPDQRRTSWLDAAAVEVAEQQQEVLCQRLADQSQAVLAAKERVQEGTYGICAACGGTIPERRLRVLPTATLCVRCQERRETALAA
jgi:DnaK suppressor protein